jgi:hypothetical protein
MTPELCVTVDDIAMQLARWQTMAVKQKVKIMLFLAEIIKVTLT